MRKIILALLATSSLAVLGAAPAEAASRNRSAFCLQGDRHPGLSNCTFTSMAQCRASASGRRLRCIANPFYKGR